MIKKKYFPRILLILVFFGFLTLFKLLQRDQIIWSEKIKLNNNESILIVTNFSNYLTYWKSIDMHIGFHKVKYIVNYFFKAKKYSWEGSFLPIILNIYNNKFYLVAKDDITNIIKPRFRYYCYIEIWREISANEFPKAIAVENLNVENEFFDFNRNKTIFYYEILEKLDITFAPFAKSNTAHIWYELETGRKLFEAPEKINQDFLINFKNKYFNFSKLATQKSSKSGPFYGKHILKDRTNKSKIGFVFQLLLFIVLLISINLWINRIEKNTADENKKKIYKSRRWFINSIVIAGFFYLVFFKFIINIYIYTYFYFRSKLGYHD